MSSIATVSVHGRGYRAPDRPVVVVCIDGSEPEYFERALAERAMPALARFRQGGVYRLARAVVPSFTNPNNLSQPVTRSHKLSLRAQPCSAVQKYPL